jgi:hypothetical protein
VGVFFVYGQRIAKVADGTAHYPGVMGDVKSLLLMTGKTHVDPAVSQLVELVRSLGQVFFYDQAEDDQQGEEQGQAG